MRNKITVRFQLNLMVSLCMLSIIAGGLTTSAIAAIQRAEYKEQMIRMGQDLSDGTGDYFASAANEGNRGPAVERGLPCGDTYIHGR